MVGTDKIQMKNNTTIGARKTPKCSKMLFGHQPVTKCVAQTEEYVFQLHKLGQLGACCHPFPAVHYFGGGTQNN
jgi:hypothetical protein